MVDAVLLLNDGKQFCGKSIGKLGVAMGEVCFTTSSTGYQHTITDPSFAHQIITFTFPHIGNVGINSRDFERSRPFAKGVVLRNNITLNPSHVSNYIDLNKWLKDNDIVGICGVDTRALTRHLRIYGSINGIISSEKMMSIGEIKKNIYDYNLVAEKELSKVVTGVGVNINNSSFKNKKKVIIVDFGMKFGIKEQLTCVDVIVVPASNDFAKIILAHNPDGVILSNGPGDPEVAAKYAVQEIKKILKTNVVVFGICLGHQLLAIALGCKTVRMSNGHRGANQPVRNIYTNKIEITSQNHGFVVNDVGLPLNIEITHRSLFDNTIEGIKVAGKPIFSVQYHPEGSPGPHDSRHLFHEFINEMNKKSTVG